MKPKILKTERDYEAALAYVARLMDQPATDEPELELWSLLVETYEDAHFPIATPDPVEAIRFRLDQSGQQATDLIPYLGSKSRVSEVMNRKRPLSLAMIRSLHAGLDIPAAVLITASPSKTRRPRTALRGKPKRPTSPKSKIAS